MNLKNDVLTILKANLIQKKILLTNRADKYNDLKVPKQMFAGDILKACKTEPRLMDSAIVLMVQHPSFILDMENLPKALIGIIENLRKGREIGEDYKGIRYKKLFALCSVSSDGRVRGSSKKKPKQFRLSGEVIEKLSKLVESGEYCSETEVIERAVLRI